MADDRDEDQLEEDRAAILRRRAVFVASAVAGLGLAASCGETSPAACLDVSRPAETNTTAVSATPPQPCLDVPPPEPPPQPCLEIAAPVDAGVEQTADAGRDAGPAPQPCLRKPAPGPCLKVAPPPPPPQACLDMPPPTE